MLTHRLIGCGGTTGGVDPRAGQTATVDRADPDVVAVKRAVRREMLARRRAMPVAERRAADAAIVERLVTELLGRGLTAVAAYVPVGTEPGGPELPALLRAAGLDVVLPVLAPDADLDWAAYTGELADGPRGLLEPPGPRLGPAAVGVVGAVVVPAVAVDRRGVRLGRGGGSYDRALARLGPVRTATALLYDGELVDVLPAEPHDRTVAAVITPAGRYPLG